MGKASESIHEENYEETFHEKLLLMKTLRVWRMEEPHLEQRANHSE